MDRFDVFLSHSSVDKQWVSKLKDDLLKYNISVWLDKDQIRPGELFLEALEKAIDQCNTIALVISPQSMKSGWVKEEYSRAMSLINSKGHVQIIPLILFDSPLPSFLSSRNNVDFRENEKYSENVYKLVWGITGNKPKEMIDLEKPTIVEIQNPSKTGSNTTTYVKSNNSSSIAEHILADINNVIALHGLDDDEWAKAISAQYFLVAIGQILHLTEQDDYKNLLNKFLRSFYHKIDGTIVLENSHILVTPEELERIVECMEEEDNKDSYYKISTRLQARNIDASLLHYNYLYGLTVQISGASKNYKILQEVHQIALNKLFYGNGKPSLDDYGGWYPYRVPWITARILTSLKYADYKSRNDVHVIESVIEKSLRSLVQRIFKEKYWRSGVGTWVTQWESTALCLEAIECWDYVPQCKSEIRKVIRYIMDNQDEWLVEPDFSSDDTSNRTLSAISLLSVISSIMTKNFTFEDFSFKQELLYNYFEKSTNAICVTSKPNYRQFCTVPQIAYYIIRALLPPGENHD